MTIKIGKMIKKLRTENNITQDMLAGALAITPQAVSRWESETTYPDLEFLPVIADYFSITIDELLGYKLSEREEALLKIKKEADRLAESASADERITYIRKALISYPFDEDLKLHLAVSLYHKWRDQPEYDVTREIQSLCMSIIKEGKHEENTYTAVITLCNVYSSLKNPEKAFELINSYTIPMKHCREGILSNGIGDGKTERYLQDEIEKLTDRLGTVIQNLAVNRDLPNDSSAWDKKIEMLNIANRLFLMIYGENLMFYHTRLAQNFWLISTYQIAQGKDTAALDSLEKMAYHALAYHHAKQNDHGKYYSSVLTDQLMYPYPNQDFHELTEHNQAYDLFNRLQNKRYDLVRDNPRFLAVIHTLKDAAI